MSRYVEQQHRTLIFVVLFFLVLAAAISAFGYKSYRDFEAEIRAETENWLVIAASAKADAVSAWQADLVDYANLIRQDPSLSSAIASVLDEPQNGKNRSLALDELNAYKQRDEIVAMELLNSQGQRLLSIPAEVPESEPVIVQTIIEEMTNKQIRFVGFYRDAASREIYISLLVPVSNGVIAIRVDPQQRLYPILAKEITKAPSIQTYLVQRDGDMTVVLSPLPYVTESPLNLRISLEKTDSLEVKAALGETGIVEGVDYNGAAMIADVRDATKEWRLVTRTSVTRMYDSIRLYFGRTVIVTATVVFYSGIGMALIWRQLLLKRYKAESEAARQRAAELDEKVRERTAELSALSRRMADLHEKQIRSLAQELHDGVGQNLTAINLNVALLHKTIPSNAPPMVESRLTDTSRLVEETVARMRNVMADFLPPMLEHYGLTPALEWYGERFARRTNLQVQVNDARSDKTRLPPQVEVGLFRIAQEALTNVAKHARASLVEIELSDSDEGMQMTIQDNGVGFEPQTTAPGASNWGFAIMQERARAMGATFDARSTPNAGTRIVLRLPRQA